MPEPLPSREPSRASTRSLALKALALVAVVLLAYWPSLDGELVYDDLLIVGQNPRLASFDQLPQTFSSSYWDFLDPEEAKHVGYYRPLTMTLMTAGYVLGGASTALLHALNLAVYALACLAAWRLATRITRREDVGFAAALLFALHPLHVESVAWISALHDPLFATFGFLGLGSFLRWRDGGSRGLPWLSGVWFLAALLSKDAAVALVPLAVALDLGRSAPRPERGGAAGLARAYGPMLAAFGLYVMARIAVFGDLLAGFDRTTTDFGVGAGRLLLLRVELLGGAVRLLAWPAELNLFRPFQPELPAGASSLWVGAVGAALWLAATVLAWRRGARPALALLLFLPAGIAPVLLRVESLGTFPLSDRFLFVPVLGFTTLIAWCAFTRLPRAGAAAVIAALGLAYGARDLARLPDWHDEEHMFRAAVAQNPRNPNVYWGLGRVLLGNYKQAGEAQALDEARECFEHSMDLLEESQGEGTDIYATHDDFLQTNLGLGWSLLYEAERDPFHDFETARTVFQRVIDYMPSSERGWIGMGIAWLGEGDPNEAGEALRRALELNPLSPEAHFNMGFLLARVQDWEGAVPHFRRSAELRNGSLEDLSMLGRALMESGQAKEAEEVARRILEQHPGEPDALVLLGIAAAREGRDAAAVAWFDRALEARPEYGAAHLHRGKALAALGQNSKAVSSFQRAVELMPESFEAHYNLMVLLRESSKPEAALPHFIPAYRLRPRGELDVLLTRAAEEMHGDNLELITTFATIDAERGDLPQAERWTRRALEIDPGYAPAKFLLGMLLKQREEFVEAYDLLHEAADGLPRSYAAQMEFAEALLQTGQERAAGPYFERALALLPQQAEMSTTQREEAAEKIQAALDAIRALDAQGPEAPSDS